MIFFGLAFTNQAHADAGSIVSKIQLDEQNCLTGDDLTTSEKESCAADAYQAADGALGKFYNETVASLKQGALADAKNKIPKAEGKAEILRRMILSERAWISFRNDNCNFESSENLGGSGEGLMFEKCMVQMTLDRMLDIDSIIKGQKDQN